MNIFKKLMSKIFHHAPQAEPQQQAANVPQSGPAPVSPSTQVPPASPTASTPAQPQVDVAAVLNDLQSKQNEDLDWKRSIVDLMKLVGMESSLSERKELADELGYTGDKSDSAAMNVWLHKQVMQKLSKNGGKVPADLLD